MKNIKIKELYILNPRTRKVIEEYYLQGNLVEKCYEGDYSELLNAIKAEDLSVGFYVADRNSIMDFANFRLNEHDKIEIHYISNTVSKSAIVNINELYVEDKKIKCSTPEISEEVEGKITFIAYLLTFKEKYKHVIEVVRKVTNKSLIEKYKNIYSLGEELATKIVYYPFLADIKNTNFDVLPEFFVTNEALNLIFEKVGDEWLDEEVFYPFSEFVINIDGVSILCKLSGDRKNIRLMAKNERGRLLFLVNCNATISGGEFNFFEFRDLKIPKDMTNEKYAISFIEDLCVLLYYYSHYKIEVDDDNNENVAKNISNNSSSKSYNSSKESSVVIPRKVININKDKVKSIKKRRTPIYNVASWKRAGYIRRYRNDEGKVIKEVLVRETVCRRKEMKSDGKEPRKKAFKVPLEAINKATKQ